MEHKLFMIETLSNTHVGSGDTNFGVVDNLIQKDPVMQVPVFHPSSIKGAIKEHMKTHRSAGMTDDEIRSVFGASDKAPGQVKFYEARLLTLPLRATRNVYYQCTSPEVILDYLDIIEKVARVTNLSSLRTLFSDMQSSIASDRVNEKEVEFYLFHDVEGLEVEDYEIYKKWPNNVEDNLLNLVKKYIGVNITRLALFRDDIFTAICDHSLPVIARNQIGAAGTSENLFYEEVLPRRSLLWFMLGLGGNHENFLTRLTSDRIQLGANASIGYGVTRIAEIPREDNTREDNT